MDFCFCTLALGSKYRLLAKELAENLETYAPQALLVIYTDEPEDFSSHRNISAFKHRQQGILNCFDDRRFVIEKALSMYSVAIHIDADSRILSHIPTQSKWQPGITGKHESLLEHAKKWIPKELNSIKSVASKLNISLENARWIGENLYIVARDEGREIEFIKQWGIIARYLELKGFPSGDGYCMGLAASKVGWTVRNDAWENLHNVTKHLDANKEGVKPVKSFWNRLQKKVNYYYRLSLAWVIALKDPIQKSS